MVVGVAGVVLLAALLGAAAGAGVRLLLRRLARGAAVAPPGCEVAVAVAWAAAGLGWACGVVPGRWLPALLGLGWFGVAVSAVDLRHHRIPDALTLPALPLALLCLLPLGGTAVVRAAGGAALVGLGHAVVHLLSPRALGAGDVKLSAPLGAVLAAAGWLAVPLAIVLAAGLTATVALAGRSAGMPAGSVDVARTAALPHGPSMVLAAGTVTAWLVVGRSGLPPPP